MINVKRFIQHVNKSLQLLGGLEEPRKPRKLCHPFPPPAKAHLRGGMLPLPLFWEIHYRRLESRMALLPTSVSQRIARLNMANKRNTIGLESSLFSSLWIWRQLGELVLSGHYSSAEFGTSVLKLWQPHCSPFLFKFVVPQMWKIMVIEVPSPCGDSDRCLTSQTSWSFELAGNQILH